MSDAAHKVVLPEGWPRPRGYSHAVVTTGSTTVRVAGQVASENGASVQEGLGVGEQWRLALANVITVVKAAGGDVPNIVSLRAFVTDLEEYKAGGAQVAEAWRATLGRHFPAMTLVEVSGLMDPNACVEIECEAVLP
jgi:enamine deaminase RidA (YjgF/YER057c/UK114 family)